MTAIKVELELVDGSFTTRMMHAGETIEQFNRNVARSDPALRKLAAANQSVIKSMEVAREKSQGFLGTLRDISIVTGVIGVGMNKLANIQDTWIGKIVQTNAEMERLIFQMRGMSTAADPIKEAAANLDTLLETAKNTPFSLDAITKGFTKLKATGTDPLKGSLAAVADGVAAFGGNDSTFERAILGMSQASGKGVLQMEELRQQIGEAMPQAMQLMAASMGISVAELVDQIGTGRVQARTALEGFYDQLERSFGGTARRMMETFSGQLARTKTELQQFARTVGGVDAETGVAKEGGFMHALSEGLQEFNEALSSAGGRNIGREIGQSLAAMVNAGRGAVEFLVRFRSELMSVAAIVGTVAGYRVMMAALRGLGGGIDTVIMSLRRQSSAFASAAAAQAVYQRALNTTGASAASMGRAASLAGIRGIAGLGSMIFRNLGVIGAVAAVIIEVANAFDLFDTKGSNAIDTLREFGEIAADQMGLAKKGLADEKKWLDTVEARASNSARLAVQLSNLKPSFNPALPNQDPDLMAQYNKLRDENLAGYDYEKLKTKYEAGLKAVQAAEVSLVEEQSRKVADARMRGMDRQLSGAQLMYNRDLAALQKSFEERRANMEKSGEKEDDIRKAQLEATNKLNREYYATQIKAYENFILEMRYRERISPMNAGDKETLKQATERLATLRSTLDNYRDVDGAVLLPETKSSANALEDAQKKIADLRIEITSLGSQLGGANKELADFEAKLNSGELGDPASEGVQKVAREMRNLLAVKQQLDDAMEGRKELTQDIESAERAAREKEMELLEREMGGKLSDAEKISLRLENGYYKGLGPNSPAMQAIQSATTGLELQSRMAEQAGAMLRGNAFGDATVRSISTVVDKLREVLSSLQGISTAVSGINFGNMSNGLNTTPSLMRPGMGTPLKISSGNAFLDFIAGPESGGDYNATLGNGRWTNGPQNLTGMTLNQIRDLQRSMLTPENQAFYGQGGSSALGRYQIVGKTLEGLMREMNLTGNELYDPAMQDRMALHLAQRRLDNGEGIQGLRNEWEGLKGKSDAEIMAALQGISKGPTRINASLQNAGLETPTAATPNFPSAVPTMDPQLAADLAAFKQSQTTFEQQARDQLAELQKKNDANEVKEKNLDLADQIKEAETAIETAKQSLDGTDKNYRAAQQWLQKNNISEDLPAAQKLLELKKQQDTVEKNMAERKSATGQLADQDVRLKEQELELERQLAEARKKIADPNFKGESSEFDSLNRSLDDYVRNVEIAHGRESTAYQAALQRKEQMLHTFRQKESAEETAASAERTRNIQTSLLTETQQRQVNMQRELAAVDAELARKKAANAADVQAVQQAEAEKAAIRAKYAAQDPMAAKMKEWGDLQGNLATGATQWMDSLADGLAGVIMGTGDLRSVLQGIAQQMLSMGLKYMFSQMKNGGGKTSGIQAPATAPTGGKKGGVATGGKALFGAKHTGGIVGGNPSMIRAVNPAVFKNARRFHSGSNMIGSGQKLLPGEVPIIARKDEGIFTPEQMKAIGESRGGMNQQININSPVTVNASGGTPEQNADLAKQVAKEMDGTIRGIVVSELQVQMKPMNMMNRK